MSAVNTIIDALRVFMPSFAKSNGTIEAKIIDVVGTYADSEAIERENTIATINTALANQRVTGKDYYRRKAVAFQLGDMLAYDPVSFLAYYPTIDENKQLVKQAYIIGNYPNFSLLVNAIGSDGHLRRMTATELNSFRTYFEAYQPLGLEININSLEVAKITDVDLVIYVQPGVDAGEAVSQINASLLAYESTFRPTNTVSLTEIEDVIQQYEGVRAVGWGNPVAAEQQIDGSTRYTYPVQGVFNLTNGAFTFATEITTDMIKVLS